MKKLALTIMTAVALALPALATSAKASSRPTSVAQDVVSFFGFGPHQGENPTDPVLVTPSGKLESPAPAVLAPVPEVKLPSLPVVAAAPAPSVEKPLHKLFCVEYARMRSGLAVFGDARHWWARAKNLYARLSYPAEEAVMVFSGSKRLRRGHVAVVASIQGPRRITVDQANWQNHGEIDHATPVLDVSPGNDWSRVRVWDMGSGQFGTHIYAISGFIAKELISRDLARQAANN